MAEQAGRLVARDEVDPKDCWDLSSLYADEAGWDRDFAAAEAVLPELRAFRGRLGEGAATLRAFLDLETGADRRLVRLYNYAARRSDEDTKNSHFSGLRDRMSALVSRSSEATSFFRPELLALPAETLAGYLAATELAPFRVVLDRIVRMKPHTLSEKEERLLALSHEATKAASEIFGQLTNADLTFGTVEDENGLPVEVTHGRYSSFLQKQDRSVRKAFFETYYRGFFEHRHTLAATLAAGVRRNVFYAKARGYESARQAALFPQAIPEAVYDNLLAGVHEKLPALYRYYELRRSLLGLDENHFYDVMVPVVPDVQMRHTYGEAVDLCLEALAPLGAEYTKTLGQGLRGGWVDRYENRGKRSGAYSSGCYDSEPFILLNFEEQSLSSVYTLAHEAGHSMHSWSSHRAQTPQDADYCIFVAEVASTFNETLLTHHLLSRTDDPRQRAYIIHREIDGLRGTLFRQTMFAEYEHLLHRRVEENQPLSLDALTGMYHEVLARYFGPDFALDPQLDLECLRIPHFYYNHYVYQYATGISAAIALSQRVLGGEPGALEAYHGFLSAGGSAYPIEILKRAGVDMTSTAPVTSALAHFERRVAELEELMVAVSV